MKLSTPKIISLLFIFTIIGAGIYSNTLEGPFVMDDMVRIEKNPDIRITSITLPNILGSAFGNVSGKSRPIANVTFALNYYFHQYDLAGFHIVNILIHILSAFFLFLFMNATLRITGYKGLDRQSSNTLPGPIPALIAVLAEFIWFVNPLHTQSVTYLIQRQNSMAAMFFILSFLLYVKGRMHGKQKTETVKTAKNAPQQKGKKTRKNPPKENGSSPTDGRKASDKALSPVRLHTMWYLGAALAWILALGCKQTAVTLPFFVFLYEWYFFQDLKKAWLGNKLKYMLGILGLLIFMAFLFLGPQPLEKILSIRDFANNEFTFVERVLTQFRVVIYYLSLIFYPDPSRLNLDYDFALSHSLIDPVTTLLSLFAIIGLIGLAFYLAKSQRLISFCIIWFFGNLVIESSIIPLALIFEHRTYLPSMLIGLPVVILAYRYGKHIWFVSAVLCGVIVLFSYWTYQRNEIWKDTVTFYSDGVEKSPQKARPRFNLALALQRQGKPEKAIPHYLAVLRLKPGYETAHLNIGHAFRRQGKLDDAVKHYKEEIRVNPDYEKTYYDLGNVLLEQKQTDEAIGYYLKALSIKPHDELAHYNLGIALQLQRRTDEAITHFMQAIRIKPDFERAHYQMGICLAKLGRTDEAIEQYTQALRINPSSEKTH
ncbi:MAG: tetratricopeptide repeat protein, partial [Deltaproteobacteria bacterium]|nr:tetratricopeptide repeat protein [Deltaproteobacteria bacterium]